MAFFVVVDDGVVGRGAVVVGFGGCVVLSGGLFVVCEFVPSVGAAK